MGLMLMQLTKESELSGDVISRVQEVPSVLLSKFNGLRP